MVVSGSGVGTWLRLAAGRASVTDGGGPRRPGAGRARASLRAPTRYAALGSARGRVAARRPSATRGTTPPMSTDPCRAPRGRAWRRSGARTGHTAHKTETRIVHYRWHPWHGRPVEVGVGERYPGVLRCYCRDGDEYARFLPAWMFDAAMCAAMRVTAVPAVALTALDALARLLTETAAVDGTAPTVQTALHARPITGATGVAATRTARVEAARAAVEGVAGGGAARRRRAPRTAAARRGRAPGGRR